MATIKISQDSIDQATSVYDAGWYTLKVDSFTLGETKNDKADLFKYTLSILDADDEQNKRFIKRKAFFQFSEKGISFGIGFLRACGASIPEKLAPGQEVTLNPDGCVGRVVKGYNVPKMDDRNTMRNNWEKFVPVEG